MRRLLVTGGAGFIGANFVRYWAGKYPDDQIVVLDALTYAGNMANLQGLDEFAGFEFVHGDIADQKLVTSLLVDQKLDTIVHFAAESHVDRSIHEPDAFIRTNVNGTHNLLRVAREVWLNRDDAPPSHLFHHVSTDEVYGTLGPDDPAFTEKTPYAPNSPYAASKAASDHLVRSYHHTFGLRVTTSNCSNNYGPYQFPEKLIPLMIVNALTGKTLPVYGDGSNIRDWLYVEDHCRGIDLVISRGKAGETYNLGGNNEHANIDIVREICARTDTLFAERPELAVAFPDAPAATGKPTESLVSFVKDRLGHDWRYAIDATKSTNELGYLPTEDFDSGLGQTIDWMLSNEAWWRAVMDGSYRAWLERNYA
ncbi:MAG: dTDP-glucose 4,6-dehydratase [Proteobacteria bacterium]|nr:dTDP-glucose 4,6-dehydratase [Pseudomonadota bacterium]MDA0993529.1 dTDP-glucose 4,6-dehydratase [Pseudomonadota bacterium]